MSFRTVIDDALIDRLNSEFETRFAIMKQQELVLPAPYNLLMNVLARTGLTAAGAEARSVARAAVTGPAFALSA